MIKMSLKNQVLTPKPKNEYVVNTPSPRAQICMSCDKDDCKGDCERFRQERDRLKKEGT